MTPSEALRQPLPRDPRDERTGKILLALAMLAALIAALVDFTAPWDGGFKGPMTSLYEEVFVRNHLEHGLSATRWSPAFFIDAQTGKGNWHWHHPPFYPLYLTAFAAVLGLHEWVLRLAHLLVFLPGIPALYWLVRQATNARHAGWAALLFASTPLVAYFGPMVCYDGPMMSGFIVSAALFWRYAHAPSLGAWTLAATAFLLTASLDFLGQFCGLGLFAMAWLLPNPRRSALAVVAMLPLSVLSVAVTALLYGQFLGGPMGFVRQMLHFSAYEQSRIEHVTAAALQKALDEMLFVFGSWPLCLLGALGVAALLAGRSPRKPLLAVVVALVVPPLLGAAVTFKHLVDHPFWPMPWMAPLAVVAAAVPATGHRLLRSASFGARALAAAMLAAAAGAVVHGAFVTQERIAFFRQNDPLFPDLLAEVGDRIEGCVAGFTNRTVISRRYAPGVIFQGDVDEPWEVDFVLAYGKNSGFVGDAAFVLDAASARPDLLARLEQLANDKGVAPWRSEQAIVYRIPAW